MHIFMMIGGVVSEMCVQSKNRKKNVLLAVWIRKITRAFSSLDVLRKKSFRNCYFEFYQRSIVYIIDKPYAETAFVQPIDEYWINCASIFVSCMSSSIRCWWNPKISSFTCYFTHNDPRSRSRKNEKNILLAKKIKSQHKKSDYLGTREPKSTQEKKK